MPEELKHTEAGSRADYAWAYYHARELGGFAEIDKMLNYAWVKREGIKTRDELLEYLLGYGQWNLAKLRIRPKDGMDDGRDITGTLTIKSGENVLIVLTLTGTVGDPGITTKEIPQAVKYVPYGTMI